MQIVCLRHGLIRNVAAPSSAYEVRVFLNLAACAAPRATTKRTRVTSSRGACDEEGRRREPSGPELRGIARPRGPGLEGLGCPVATVGLCRSKQLRFSRRKRLVKSSSQRLRTSETAGAGAVEWINEQCICQGGAHGTGGGGLVELI